MDSAVLTPSREQALVALRHIADHGLGAAAPGFETRADSARAGISLLFELITSEIDAALADTEAQVAAGNTPDHRKVLEAIYLPYLALIYHPQLGFTAFRFASRLLTEADGEIQAAINESVAPLAMRTLLLLQAALPHIPGEVVAMRTFATVTLVVHLSSDLAAMTDSPFGDLYLPVPGLLFSRLFDFLGAAVSAPETEPDGSLDQRLKALSKKWM